VDSDQVGAQIEELAADSTAGSVDSTPEQPRRTFGITPQRVALFLIAGLAGLSYAWGISSDALEPLYAATVRSMAANWHNFAYGSLDPAGTVTIDKLPGALWIQALSVRAFGYHTCQSGGIALRWTAKAPT
jgi:hypothetical protein